MLLVWGYQASVYVVNVLPVWSRLIEAGTNSMTDNKSVLVQVIIDTNWLFDFQVHTAANHRCLIQIHHIVWKTESSIQGLC